MEAYFVNDEQGQTKFVQLPLEAYNKLMEEVANYRELNRVRKAVESSQSEWKDIVEGKKPRITLQDFVNEL